MSSSELEIKRGSKVCIVSFGGRALKFGGILPFEFQHFLEKHFPTYDKLFYIDKKQINYHQGIENISSNIDETVEYLRKKIENYEKVIFMGVSAGGYAALLFGSLLQVYKVIAFIPQTILYDKKYENKYKDIKLHIHKDTFYYVFGDTSVKNKSDPHHIYHCENIETFQNVCVIKKNGISLVQMRNSGELYTVLQSLFIS